MSRGALFFVCCYCVAAAQLDQVSMIRARVDFSLHTGHTDVGAVDNEHVVLQWSTSIPRATLETALQPYAAHVTKIRWAEEEYVATKARLHKHHESERIAQKICARVKEEERACKEKLHFYQDDAHCYQHSESCSLIYHLPPSVYYDTPHMSGVNEVFLSIVGNNNKKRINSHYKYCVCACI